MNSDYKGMFEILLIFVPALMILSYLAGTSHDMPKKPKDFGFKFKKKILKVCSGHSSKVSGPAVLVTAKDCNFCNKKEA